MSVAIELVELKASPAPGAAVIEVPRALIRMENSSLEVTIPDATVSAGPTQTAALKGGRFTAVDVAGPAPAGEVAFKLMSSLPSALAIASRPPYSLLHEANAPADNIDGKIDGQFSIKFPLSGQVSAAAAKVEGKARISDIRLKKKIGAVELQGGTINVDVTEQAIDATGELLLNGVIAKLSGQRIFDAAPDKQPPLRIKATLDNADRNQLGLDVNHMVQGDMPVEVTVAPATATCPRSTCAPT